MTLVRSDYLNKQFRVSRFGFLTTILIMMLCVNWLWALDSRDGLEYSEVRQLFEQEKVESFSISNKDVLTMYLRNVENPVSVRVKFDLFYDDLNDLVLEQKAAGIYSVLSRTKAGEVGSQAV